MDINHFRFVPIIIGGMEQQPRINDKLVKNFQELEGFGGKKYLVYVDPNNSSILAEPEEYEIYRNEYQRREQPHIRQNDLGFNVSMKKNKPINITKEQEKIQERIETCDKKPSRITVAGSQFMSEIFEGNYHRCEMCEANDQIILDLKMQISKLEQAEKDLKNKISLKDLLISSLEASITVLQRETQLKDRIIAIKDSEVIKLTEQITALHAQLKSSQLPKVQPIKEQDSESQKSSQGRLSFSSYDPSQKDNEESLSSKKSSSIILLNINDGPYYFDLTQGEVSEIRSSLEEKSKSLIGPFDETMNLINNLASSKTMRPFAKSIVRSSIHQ